MQTDKISSLQSTLSTFWYPVESNLRPCRLVVRKSSRAPETGLYLDHRDQSFWDFLFNPDHPKDVHEALVRFDRLVNRPEVTDCPFLLVASEYPDPAHPVHRRVIEHKDKLLAYLIDLLKPFAIDRKAAAVRLLIVIDGALSLRLVHGSAREAPLLSSASAILEAFQKPSRQRRRS